MNNSILDSIDANMLNDFCSNYLNYFKFQNKENLKNIFNSLNLNNFAKIPNAKN